MKRGPKPGSKKSEETKRKIRDARLGTNHSSETKNRISESMASVPKSKDHKNNISKTRTSNIDRNLKRFEDMRSEYPTESKFFEDNRDALLEFMEEVRSEKELTQLRKHIEVSNLDRDLSFDYPSTSIFAVEDILVEILDFKRELFRQVGELSDIDVTH